jgi:hypothetical protein
MPRRVIRSRPPATEKKDDKERRRTVRKCCALEASWRLFGPQAVGSGTGKVHNLSTRGISLVLDCSVECGVFLDLTLHQTEAGLFSMPLLARVRHVTLRSEGVWIIGCRFLKRLSDAELQDLLPAEIEAPDGNQTPHSVEAPPEVSLTESPST